MRISVKNVETVNPPITVIASGRIIPAPVSYTHLTLPTTYPV